MPTIYCETWSTLIHEPDEPLTEAEAAARHERGGLYTVVWIEEGKDVPTAAVEVRLELGYTRIYRFDMFGNVAHTATFKRHGDRMFMEQATFNEYLEPRFQPYEKADTITHLILEPDGTGIEYVTVGGTKTSNSLSLKDGKAMADYWAPIPAFGDYDDSGVHQVASFDDPQFADMGLTGHGRVEALSCITCDRAVLRPRQNR